jgi:hypothetical protein
MGIRLKTKRSASAISLSLVALIVIGVILAASLIAYDWSKGFNEYVASETSTLKNAKALRIQCMAVNITSGALIVYIENVGEGTVNLNSECILYVNDVKLPLLSGAIDRNSLAHDQTATIQVPYLVSPDTSVKVRIVTAWGASIQTRSVNPDSLPAAFTLTVNVEANGDNHVTKNPDQSSYACGTVVTLTAKPQGDWGFQGWSGDLNGTDNPVTIIINANKIVNASFAQVASNSGFSNSGPAETNTQNVGDSDHTSDSSNQKVQVTFTQFGLDSSATGTIVTASGLARNVSDFPFSVTMDKGDIVSYAYAGNVTSSITGTRFKLTGVEGPASPITATGNAIVNGSYEVQYEVQFAVSPKLIDATINPVENQWITSGKSITVESDISSNEYEFAYWSASTPSISFSNASASSTTATINGPGTVTANFRIPTRMEWLTMPSSVNRGSVENLTGILYSPIKGWSAGDLNGKTVTVIITAPNETQFSMPLITHAVSSTMNGVFAYQFKPSTVGIWTVSATFNEDATFKESALPLTSFTVSAGPKYQVTFEQSGADGATASLTVNYEIDGGPTQTSIVPFSVQIVQGSSISFTYQVSVAGAYGSRYVLVSTNPSSPQTVSNSLVIIGSYKTQYRVTFLQNGLNSSATGTVVTIGNKTQTKSQMPYSDWFDRGTTFSYSSMVSGSPGERFALTSVNYTSPITAAGTIMGTYKTQYYLTVNSPDGTDATGQNWYDAGSTVSSVASPVTINGPLKITYAPMGCIGTGSAPSGTGTSIQFIISSPSSLTWKWHGQLTLYPDGDQSIEIPHSTGASGHWQCVSDADKSDGTAYVYAGSGDNRDAEWFTDYYSVQDHASVSGTIDSVTVFVRCQCDRSNAAYAQTYIKLGDNYSNGTQYALSTKWTDHSDSLAKPGGGSWSWDDIDNIQCGVGLNPGSNKKASCTLVWIVVDFTT